MSGTATIRRELEAKLRTALPKGFVLFPKSSDDIIRPTLILQRTTVTRHPQAPMGAWMNTFELIVTVPQHAGEDALDTALEDLIEALDSTDIAWTDATRAVYAGSSPCYSLNLSATSTRKDA